MATDLYRHRKTGGQYRLLIDIATLEATMEEVVVYRSISTGQTWVRPRAEFFDGRFEGIKTK